MLATWFKCINAARSQISGETAERRCAIIRKERLELSTVRHVSASVKAGAAALAAEMKNSLVIKQIPKPGAHRGNGK